MARPFAPALRRSRPAAWLGTRRPRLEHLEDRTLLSVAEPAYFPPQQYAFEAGGYLTEASTQPALVIAENYLRSHAADFGLAPSDLDNYVVTTSYVTESTGATTLILQQTYDGLPVENSNFKITVAEDGRLVSVGGGFVPGLSQTTQYVAAPDFPAATSVSYAAAGFGMDLGETPTVVGNSRSGRTLVSAPSISTIDVPTDLHYVPLPDGSVRLAWNVTIRTPGEPHQYNANVDAATGELISMYDQVAGASYEVFALPSRSPLDGPRSIVTDPHIISPAPAVVPSPFGWHDTNGVPGNEFTVTRGNNTNTFLDRDGDFTPDANAQPDGGANLDFTGSLVPFNPASEPPGNIQAATTNMFYWMNTLHDVHYLYGFNEAAGNFQFNNYGRGGLGFDPIQGLVQQSADLFVFNNAFYFPAPDGEMPLIAMFNWSLTTPQRDGDFDNEIIIHEYGHGVSTRLSGGSGLGLFTQQGGAMGEGWSDWWSLMLTQKSASETIDGRGGGNYALGLDVDGPGIRRFRYDWDIDDINLQTFENYGLTGIQSIEVHDAGELWASALWDINHLFVQKYGFEPNMYNSTSTAGNIRALHLVMNALKIQPVAPSFIEARDAILLADQLLYGGANQLEIWTAFARRGLGQFASTAGPDDFEVFTSFDVPPTVFRPTASIGSDVSVTEGDNGSTNMVFAVSISGFGVNPVFVSYATVDGTATAGSDYTAQSGTLTFDPGTTTTQLITIQVLGDEAVEGNETFLVRLSDPVNGDLGRSEATGTIINDDNGLTINDVTITEGNTTLNAVFTVSLAAPSANPVSVTYNTVGITAAPLSDFVSQAGTLNFPAGVTAQTITVPIIGDLVSEPTETFTVLLSNPNGVRLDRNAGVGTIVDNDAVPALYVSDAQVTTVPGGQQAAVFTVGMDFGSGHTVFVNYLTTDGSAVAGVDYEAQSGTVSFAPGVTTRQIIVPVLAGTVPAPDKTFFVNLSSPVNANVADSQGVGTVVFSDGSIVDNGDSGYINTTGWTTVTNTVAYGLDYDYAPAGTGNVSATWTFSDRPSGSYEVFARWSAFSNRATNAPYMILDGANPLATVLVNQQIAPVGVPSDGVSWQSLGTFEISSDTLSVRLSNGANGFVTADAIRVVAAGGTPQPGPAHNAAMPQDVNNDGRVAGIDLLLVVNHLMAGLYAPSATPAAAVAGGSSPATTYYVDVNNDSRVSAVDVLMIVNYMLSRTAVAPSAAPAARSADPGLTAVAVDNAIGSLDADEPQVDQSPWSEEWIPAAAVPADQASEAQPSAATTGASMWAFADDSDEDDDEGSVVERFELALLDD